MHKVLFLIDTLEVGGAERSLLECASRLDRSRFEPVVCQLYRGEGLAAAFERAGIRLVSLRLPGKYQFLRAAGRFRRVVCREAPALIHTTLFRAGQVGRVVGAWCRVPVISSFVNLPYDPIRFLDNPNVSQGKLNLLRRLDAWSCRFVTHFHAVSQTARDSNCRHLGVDPARVSVIPRGRDPQAYLEAAGEEVLALRQELQLDRAYPVLLNVGRIIDQKGQRYLIQALPHVLQRFPRAQLLLAGDGWMRSRLVEEVEKLGLKPHVRFLGVRKDVPALLQLADCFVFPSLYEGLGGAVVEAMLAGRPVVASDIPVLREVIDHEDTGLLASTQHVASLAECIVRLASDRGLAARLGRRAQEVACQRYDIRQVVRRTERLYEEVVAAHREGRPVRLVEAPPAEAAYAP